MNEQSASGDSALKCLVDIARLRGVELSVERLRHDHVLDSREPSTRLLLRLAEDSGLKAKSTKLSWKQLGDLGKALPVIARLRNGNSVMIVGLLANPQQPPVVMVRDPLAADPTPFPVDEHRFVSAWTGEVILIKRDNVVEQEEKAFGLSWFVPEIIRQRRLFRDVAISAILLGALGMALPIFSQIIIDRVLVHHSISTLYVLCIGIVIATLFETILTALRRYLLLFATNKVDAQINVQTFNKLLSLPIDFFEHNSTGVIIKNLSQTGRIRGFLTGQVFSALLDSVSLIVLMPMMFLYSMHLSLIVLALTAVVSILVICFLPALKEKMNDVYQAEARQQGFLVESIQGIRTIKSLSLDARQKQTWDRYLSQSIETRFEMSKLSMVAQSLIGPVDKIMQILIMSIGAYMVFDGTMMVGGLIAFKMIVGRVTGPLIQLAMMSQQFQEITLSLRMLGAIMNHPSEEGRTGVGLRVPLKGEVEFDDIRFRYSGAGSNALDGVSFKIPAGTIFGVMGRSGSGKTTVTRLLQALNRPQEGLIKIDGHDLREIDLDHLRSNIGVVLQESFLFRGTIRENIAAGKPGATFEEVVEAARLAGADEFIERLPRGFDTMLEEGSTNLSGGQRQRLAIARALLINPRILILDEATSALDAESEAIVQANLMSIAKGRTLIIISHRLSSLVASDAILVLDRGKVMDQGRHHELLGRCAVYQHLWYKQNRHLEAVS